MYHLFETISIRNGIAENLPWHRERFEASYLSLFGKMPGFSLADVLRVPPEARQGHFRCRIDYGKEIKAISFQLVLSREINSLRLVEDNKIDYPYKFADRLRLEKLYTMRGDADDVLIVKNGFITDTSVANILLWDGRQWLTPSEPLLPGTCRARLLDCGEITGAEIKPSELRLFRKVKLINALRGMEDTKSIPVTLIR